MSEEKQGKKIKDVQDFIEAIRLDKPLFIDGKEFTAKQADSTSIGWILKQIKLGNTYELKDLEHFESGVTVGELIKILRDFPAKAPIIISGLYGADTDTFCGFKMEKDKLLIMTDLSTG
jgi:hypothetical protein